MAASVLHTFLRWTAAVLCGFALSLAYAQAPHAARGGFMAQGNRVFARAPVRPASASASRGGPRRQFGQFGMTVDPYGHGGPRAAPVAAIPPPGPFYRPVSEEARTFAREGGAVYLRAGSIRADIARYNEERGPNHAVPHPPTRGARSSESPPVYRN